MLLNLNTFTSLPLRILLLLFTHSKILILRRPLYSRARQCPRFLLEIRYQDSRYLQVGFDSYYLEGD